MGCGSSAAEYNQIPDLWGSKQAVPDDNFVPVSLTNFQIDPGSLAPLSWDGRIVMLFVLKDGAPHTKLSFHVTSI